MQHLPLCATTRSLDTLHRNRITLSASAARPGCRLISCLGEKNSGGRFLIKFIPLPGPARPPIYAGKWMLIAPHLALVNPELLKLCCVRLTTRVGLARIACEVSRAVMRPAAGTHRGQAQSEYSYASAGRNLRTSGPGGSQSNPGDTH